MHMHMREHIWHIIEKHLAHRHTSGTSVHIWHIGTHLAHRRIHLAHLAHSRTRHRQVITTDGLVHSHSSRTSSSSQSGGVLQQFPRCGIAHSSSLSWLASRATPAHRRWPRRMHPSPLPSIILTLPFHSEFQIPQNGIPHSNFLSHSKVEPLAPNTNIKYTTGYWAPVRIRSAAWSSASPDGREVGRLAAVHPIVGLLLVCASRTSSSRSSTTRTPEVHIAGTVDVDVPLLRAGGAPSTAPLVPRAVVRTSRSCARSASAVDVDVKADVDVRSLIICTRFRGAHRRHGQ